MSGRLYIEREFPAGAQSSIHPILPNCPGASNSDFVFDNNCISLPVNLPFSSYSISLESGIFSGTLPDTTYGPDELTIQIKNSAATYNIRRRIIEPTCISKQTFFSGFKWEVSNTIY